MGLWCLNEQFALILGLFAALTNLIPYIGQIIGGALPTAIAMGQTGLIGDGLLVAAMYLAVVGIEGYVVTPLVMGRSLDLNGTTVLIACLFWAYLWGLIGLILAMPITVSLKLVFRMVPELNRWAQLMSLDWQFPLSNRAWPGHRLHQGRPRPPAACNRNGRVAAGHTQPVEAVAAGSQSLLLTVRLE